MTEYWLWLAAAPIAWGGFCFLRAAWQRFSLVLDMQDEEFDELDPIIGSSFVLSEQGMASLRKVSVLRHAWRLFTFRDPWSLYHADVRRFFGRGRP